MASSEESYPDLFDEELEASDQKLADDEIEEMEEKNGDDDDVNYMTSDYEEEEEVEEVEEEEEVENPEDILSAISEADFVAAQQQFYDSTPADASSADPDLFTEFPIPPPPPVPVTAPPTIDGGAANVTKRAWSSTHLPSTHWGPPKPTLPNFTELIDRTLGFIGDEFEIEDDTTKITESTDTFTVALNGVVSSFGVSGRGAFRTTRFTPFRTRLIDRVKMIRGLTEEYSTIAKVACLTWAISQTDLDAFPRMLASDRVTEEMLYQPQKNDRFFAEQMVRAALKSGLLNLNNLPYLEQSKIRNHLEPLMLSNVNNQTLFTELFEQYPMIVINLLAEKQLSSEFFGAHRPEMTLVRLTRLLLAIPPPHLPKLPEMLAPLKITSEELNQLSEPGIGLLHRLWAEGGASDALNMLINHPQFDLEKQMPGEEMMFSIDIALAVIDRWGAEKYTLDPMTAISEFLNDMPYGDYTILEVAETKLIRFIEKMVEPGSLKKTALLGRLIRTTGPNCISMLLKNEHNQLVDEEVGGLMADLASHPTRLTPLITAKMITVEQLIPLLPTIEASLNGDQWTALILAFAAVAPLPTELLLTESMNVHLYIRLAGSGLSGHREMLKHPQLKELLMTPDSHGRHALLQAHQYGDTAFGFVAHQLDDDLLRNWLLDPPTEQHAPILSTIVMNKMTRRLNSLVRMTSFKTAELLLQPDGDGQPIISQLFDTSFLESMYSGGDIEQVLFGFVEALMAKYPKESPIWAIVTEEIETLTRYPSIFERMYAGELLSWQQLTTLDSNGLPMAIKLAGSSSFSKILAHPEFDAEVFHRVLANGDNVLMHLISQQSGGLVQTAIKQKLFSAADFEHVNPNNAMNALFYAIVRYPGISQGLFALMLKTASAKAVSHRRPDGYNLLLLSLVSSIVRGQIDLVTSVISCRHFRPQMLVDETSDHDYAMLHLLARSTPDLIGVIASKLKGPVLSFRNQSGEGLLHALIDSPAYQKIVVDAYLNRTVELPLEGPLFDGIDDEEEMILTPFLEPDLRGRVPLNSIRWTDEALTKITRHSEFTAEMLTTPFGRRPSLLYTVFSGNFDPALFNAIPKTMLTEERMMNHDYSLNPVVMTQSVDKMRYFLALPVVSERILCQPNVFGHNVLLTAIEDNNPAMVKMLLESTQLGPELFNATVDSQPYGFDAFTAAIRRVQVAVVDQMLMHPLMSDAMLNRTIDESFQLRPIELMLSMPNFVPTITALLTGDKFDLSPSFVAGSSPLRSCRLEYLKLVVESKYFSRELITDTDVYHHHLLHVTDPLTMRPALEELGVFEESDLSAQDHDGDHILVMNSSQPDTVAELLMKNPELLSLTSRAGYNGFNYAISKGHYDSFMASMPHLTEEIYRQRNYLAQTVFHLAAQQGMNFVSQLEQCEWYQSSMWGEVDATGRTPLYYLSLTFPDSVHDRYTPELGRICNREGESLLMQLMPVASELVDELLVEHPLSKEDLLLRNDRFETLAFYAAEHSASVLKRLLNHPEVESEICYLASTDHENILDRASKSNAASVEVILNHPLCDRTLIATCWHGENFLHRVFEKLPAAARAVLAAPHDFSFRLYLNSTERNSPAMMAAIYSPSAFEELLESKYWSNRQLYVKNDEQQSLIEAAFHHQPRAFLAITRTPMFSPMLLTKFYIQNGDSLMREFLEQTGCPDFESLIARFRDFPLVNEAEPDPMKACTVCYLFRPKIFFQPCGHAFCVACALKATDCHACRTGIEQRQLIY